MNTPSSLPCPLCGRSAWSAFSKSGDTLYRRCRFCGGICLVEPPQEQELRQNYNTRYYRPDFSGRGPQSFSAFQYRLDILDRLGLLPGMVLEVGAASGEFLSLLRARGWQVEGVELSEPAVRAARDQYGLSLFCGTLNQAAFPAETFDVVALYHVLEHLPDPVAQLREVRRVLRPGGIVIIELPHPTGFDARHSAKCRASIIDYPHHLFLFPPATIRRLLLRTGFVQRRVEYSFSFLLAGILRRIKTLLFGVFVRRSKTARLNVPSEAEPAVFSGRRRSRHMLIALLSRLFPGMKMTVVAQKPSTAAPPPRPRPAGTLQ